MRYPHRSPGTLPHGLRAVAAIASGPHVVECKSQVWPLGNGNLVVSVEVAVAASERSTEFVKHLLRRWDAESGLPEHSDNIRLPPTIHAAPVVALEAENPEAAVIRIVTTLSAGATAFVLFTLPRPAVGRTGSAGGKFGAARHRTRMKNRHPNYLDVHDATGGSGRLSGLGGLIY
jgi:hypothetical protein